MARIVPATSEWIENAADILKSGGLVAFPTETVYGLGANALDPEAVAKIFEAKGRPATNPVIVHVGDLSRIDEICDFSNPYAMRLADAFWPGPLTLVLPKKPIVPNIVTAGGETLGVRIPNHLVALELLKACGLPIAAPSANRSEEVSPTNARHVADSLRNDIDLILDGGACKVGIESTVLDLVNDKPRILRPGHVSAAQIEEILGGGVLIGSGDSQSTVTRAPGQMLRHYAPKKQLRLITNLGVTNSESPGFANGTHPIIYGIVADNVLTDGRSDESGHKRRSITMPKSPKDYARELYGWLRWLDKRREVISMEVEMPPDLPEWAAIRDRLKRAATPKA